ncbi:hypothetical protein Zmor_002328 [Zophobas morio]|uniref:Uncharacterized protein n=1 Tax=Zophobas morio TaxID=2755281 RepID=A0AA38MPX3_9CUCU|nr:hypothetical protein Zmor_002328 [Zophobas morio]
MPELLSINAALINFVILDAAGIPNVISFIGCGGGRTFVSNYFRSDATRVLFGYISCKLPPGPARGTMFATSLPNKTNSAALSVALEEPPSN